MVAKRPTVAVDWDETKGSKSLTNKFLVIFLFQTRKRKHSSSTMRNQQFWAIPSNVLHLRVSNNGGLHFLETSHVKFAAPKTCPVAINLVPSIWAASTARRMCGKSTEQRVPAPSVAEPCGHCVFNEDGKIRCFSIFPTSYKLSAIEWHPHEV